MNDIGVDFVDILEIFKNPGNDSNVPLFFGCTKFMKISVVFKLYNLKLKTDGVIKVLPLYYNF
jgi:hypothetical protein